MSSRLTAFSVFAALAVAGACYAPEEDNVGDDRRPNGDKADGIDDGADERPLYLTGAFDGSKRFGMWIATMEFARDFQQRHGKALHFTYFINTCYYDHTTTGSAIGRSHSRAEDIVRSALTQQAINEGHEIGNHSVLHLDGSEWSFDRWHQEFTNFEAVAQQSLFEPIFDSSGEPVFPRWEPTASGSATGAACSSDGQCDSGECLMVAPDQGFCTQGCNGNRTCPNDTVCGAPDWSTSTDRCVPMPSFPVVHNGTELFDADGNPNLAALTPYRMIGFRAPQLGRNASMLSVLRDFGYEYDTSDAITGGIQAPYLAHSQGQTFDSIVEYGLMKNTTPGHRALTIPMDYNYKVNDGSYERMFGDYKQSIVDAYQVHGRVPWNIGHHFALWRNGDYWRAMKDAFEFAAEGCPAGGTLQCEDVEFPSFAELHQKLRSMPGSRSLIVDDRSPSAGAPYSIADGATMEAEPALHGASCPCGGEDTP